MYNFIKFISGLGEITILITPLTFTIGIINAIKKPENESKKYKIMAIISAYLIFSAAISI